MQWSSIQAQIDSAQVQEELRSCDMRYLLVEHMEANADWYYNMKYAMDKLC